MSGANAHSHLMKTTKRGRPFLKDTSDLFSTLIISLPLDSHRSFFKSYPNSFVTYVSSIPARSPKFLPASAPHPTSDAIHAILMQSPLTTTSSHMSPMARPALRRSDEACANLSSLKFSQSTRSADPKDPTRIITTTTTTTFSMSRDMAKGICQHFMDGRLIENATDLGSTSFKDRGVYMVTAKGLHVLERFITKNGIAADHVIKLYTDQPITMKLLHLERRSADDDIIITKSVIDVIWRRFVGMAPNVCTLSEEDIAAQLASRWYAKSSIAPGAEFDRSLGLLVRKVPLPAAERKGSGVMDEYTFPAQSAVDWLCEYSTAAGPDEAGDVLAQFLRYGFITLLSDKAKPRDSDMIFTARAGGAGGAAGAIMAEAEFRVTAKSIYKITKEGLQNAKWNIPGVQAATNASKPNLHATDSAGSVKAPSRTSHSADEASAKGSPGGGRAGTKETLRVDTPMANDHAKDSHTARLKQIMDEPALRSLFREFLRDMFCEENLSFWLDCQDFKKKFNTTSSTHTPGAAARNGVQAMEKHQSELLAMAYVVYNTYLAPASPAELNIEHSVRAELIHHVNAMNAEKEAMMAKGGHEGQISPTLATQLQTLVRLYEKIQSYIYRLMATDSVPKFCKTERYTTVMKTLFDANQGQWDDASDQKLMSRGDEGSPTRAYITISQAANEKAAAAERLKELEKQKAGGRR